jgi:hypothetical protein
VYDVGSSLTKKLSYVIQGSIWRWPPACSDDVVEIQAKLS